IFLDNYSALLAAYSGSPAFVWVAGFAASGGKACNPHKNSCALPAAVRSQEEGWPEKLLFGGIMRAINISLMVLRLAFLVVIILGILFWTGNAQNLTLIHMLLGFIVVISLWVIGLAQRSIKGGSFALAVATFVLGLILAIVGLYQTGWLVGSSHWIIQVIHLLLGLSAIGLGEMITRRTKRRLRSTEVQRQLS